MGVGLIVKVEFEIPSSSFFLLLLVLCSDRPQGKSCDGPKSMHDGRKSERGESAAGERLSQTFFLTNKHRSGAPLEEL